MRFLEIAARDDVVEDHRYAQRANLDGRVSSVFDVEPQDQAAIFHQPGTRNLHRAIGWECRREIGARERLSGCRQRLNWFARIRRVVLLPWTRTARAHPQR